MTKAQLTLLVTLLITAIGIFVTGEMRSFFFTIGVTGIVGCGTNVLAIRMLFDRIYLLPKWKKWPLPYSGILELQREKIALAIGWVVSKKLVSPEAIMRMVTSADFKGSIHATVQEKLADISRDPNILAILGRDLTDALVSFVDSDVFRNNLRITLYKHLGLVGGALITSSHFRSRESITPYFQNEMRLVLESIGNDPKFYQKLSSIIENLPEKIFSTPSQIKENLRQHGKEILQEVIQKLDLHRIVAAEVANFEPGEMSHLVLKITAENLDWLEVWGGFLGVLGGMLFWGISKYLF